VGIGSTLLKSAVQDDVTEFAVTSIATLDIGAMLFIVADLCESGLTTG
jgi:hypothetical protein